MRGTRQNACFESSLESCQPPRGSTSHAGSSLLMHNYLGHRPPLIGSITSLAGSITTCLIRARFQV